MDSRQGVGAVLERVQEVVLRWYKRARAKWLGLQNRDLIEAVRRELDGVLREWPGKVDLLQLEGEERGIVEEIRKETAERNRNNVTRTMAYWELYRRRPELHWALLAHLVSRNGGYQMTDLKGDPISRLMKQEEAVDLFSFLERSNYLIFGDAYPQLRLYEESRKRGRPLFHLLPCFGVSRFMEVIWRRFWESRDSALLTIGLVVNEQNFIEKRVVQHRKYRQVVQSFEFQAQNILNLTHVGFPFGVEGQERLELAGVTVQTFLSLSERIDMGRRLYAILFGVREVLEGATAWAERTPHTGSRADYWPHLFSAKRLGAVDGKYVPAVQGAVLRKGAAPLYSPPLRDAWEDVRDPEAAGGRDWLVSSDVAEELYQGRTPHKYNISCKCCSTLMMMERAAVAETLWEGR
jgi:hypothetical protein